MLKNFIKIAFRNLWKHKFYSLLNVAGLAIGMTCALLVVLFITDELSFDQYHENVDNLYRINIQGSFGGREIHGTWQPAPLAKTMVEDFPEVINATRFRVIGNFMIKYGENNIKEERFAHTDTETFQIFSFPFVAGDPKTCLDEPNTLVITETTAKKYFGNENPVGKTVLVDNQTDFKVTGVIKDIPRNTHFNFDVFASLESLPDSRNDIWLNQNYQTYLLLADGAKPADLEAKFPDFLMKYFGPQLLQFMGVSLQDFFKQGNAYNMYMQPVANIHLRSDLDGEIGVNSDIKYIYIFAAVGIFILLIACVNFMNLSTARSAGRAREVGVRKVLGSFKKQLVNQFLTESMLLSIFAFMLALLSVYLILPYFNNLSGKELSLSDVTGTYMVISMMAITLSVGLLAGSYPAFFISAFKPVDVLKGKLSKGAKSGFLRSALVIFQFTTSIILIVGTLVVYDQLHFIQNKKVGFDREQVLIIEDTWLMGLQVFSFKEALKQNPDIKSVTVSSYLPTPSNRSGNMYFKEGEVMTTETTSLQQWFVDVDYIPTMGMELVAGRNFSDKYPTDSSAIIINEATVKQFSLGENPVGKRLGRYVGRENTEAYYNIIGVVKDFHYESLRQNIRPLVLLLGGSTGKTCVRIKPGNYASVINFIEEEWNKFAPGNPFDYKFMDEEFNKVYDAEMRLGNIFTIFALLAIFIGCLGLLGLAAFTAEQRTKEIGIRKTLGATVQGIVFLLSKEFGKLVVIAFAISVPISYFAMNSWLSDFAYRIELTYSVFILAGLIAFFISLLTVGYHAVKAALANPVKSLRYE